MIKLFFKGIIVSAVLFSTFIFTLNVEASDKHLVLFNTTNSNVNTTDVLSALKNDLLSINYDSAKIVNIIAPTYYTTAEKLNKKKEIAEREGRKDYYNISDDIAIAELKKDSIYKTPYQEDFKYIQDNLDSIITNLINKDKERTSTSLRDSQFYIDLISNNKEAFLVGLTYINTMYDFNFGSINLKDNILYNANSYGNDVDVLNMIINLGKMQSNDYLFNRNVSVFNRYLANNFNSANLIDFIEKNRVKYLPDITTKEWFKNTSKAIILETNSQELNSVDVSLYNKLASDTNLQNHILPLLTIPENTLFAISNITSITYGNVDSYVDASLKSNVNYNQKIDEFKLKLESAANAQRRFIDTWLRISKSEDKNDLISNRIVIDTFRRFSLNTTEQASLQWSKEFGNDAISGVKYFFTPLKYYDTYRLIDGQADGSGFRMFNAKILDERGISTYSHEMTHLLEENVWLNNNKTRDGLEVEFYATGLYESYYLDKPLFSLNMMYERNVNSFNNANPERFTNAQDLKQYMSNLLDVLYTLDYLEGDVLLSKSTQEKQKWFNVIEQVNDTGTRSPATSSTDAIHKEDSVRRITEGEANSLTNFNSLIDNNIIAFRYEVNGRNNTGLVKSNGYYTIPYFSPIYAAPTNDKGVSGDILSKKYAFELLGEYGYFEGMVPFISNQYKAEAEASGSLISDSFLINKISSQTYTDMASFKKAMFEKRINKLSELKQITINYNGSERVIKNSDDLRNIIKEAIEADLANNNNFLDTYSRNMPDKTEIEKVKSEIFKAYKVLTADFRNEIYEVKNSSNTIYVTKGNEDSKLGNGSEQNPYQSLSFALENAKDGDTIILLDDILYRGDGVFTIDKEVTIEGNNHKINFRGQNLETLANVKFSDLTLNMIPNGSDIPKIYASGNSITFDNVSTLISASQSYLRPMIIGGTKDESTTSGNKTVINILGGSSETRFNKIVAGNEFADSDIPVEINIDSDFAKVDNGISLGGLNGNQTHSKVVLNSNSKEIKKIDGENSIDNSVVLKKNNIYGVSLNNVIDFTLSDNAKVALNNDFSGIYNNITVSSGSQLKIDTIGNVTFNNILGDGEIVISPNTNINVLENVESDISIKINGLGANFSSKKDNVYVDVSNEIKGNLSVSVTNSSEGYYIEKVNNQYILRAPVVNVKISINDLTNSNSKQEIVTVVNSSNNSIDYFEHIVEEISNDGFVGVFTNTSGVQTVKDSKNNLLEVIFDVKKVGKLIIDGNETNYSISVDENRNQIVKYRVNKVDNKVYVFKDSSQEFPLDNYNKDIVLDGDLRFSNIELISKDTTNTKIEVVVPNQKVKVDNIDQLSESEIAQIKTNIINANTSLSLSIDNISFDANSGNFVVSVDDKDPVNIQKDRLVELKPELNIQNIEKVFVNDINSLSANEIDEIKTRLKNANADLNLLDSEINISNTGVVVISKDGYLSKTISPDLVVIQKEQVTINVPTSKVQVFDKTNLTAEEINSIKQAIKNSNPELNLLDENILVNQANTSVVVSLANKLPANISFENLIEEIVVLEKDRYNPVPNNITVETNSVVNAQDLISNKEQLPNDVVYKFANEINTTVEGVVNVDVIVEYSDGSSDVVLATINVVAPAKKAILHPATVSNGAVEYMTNADLEAVKNDILNKVVVSQDAGNVDRQVIGTIPNEKGTFKIEVKVTYDDASFMSVYVDAIVKEVPVVISDAQKYEPITQEVTITEGMAVSVNSFIVNKDLLPPATSFGFSNNVDTSILGEQNVVILVTYPDQSSETVSAKLTVNKKVVIKKDAEIYEPSINGENFVIVETKLNDGAIISANEKQLVLDKLNVHAGATLTVDENIKLENGEYFVLVSVKYLDDSIDSIRVFVKNKPADTKPADNKPVVNKPIESKNTYSNNILPNVNSLKTTGVKEYIVPNTSYNASYIKSIIIGLFSLFGILIIVGKKR